MTASDGQTTRRTNPRTMRLPGSVAEIESSPAGPRIGAFFDLDGTLIAGFSAIEFVRDGLLSGRMSASAFGETLLTAARFQMGQLSFSAFVSGTAGTLRGGFYITPRSPGAATDQAGAKRECDALAAKNYAVANGWQLANPTQLRQFIGNPAIKRSRYWTSALHEGRGLVFTLPQGKKDSEKADRKIARPFCVVRY